jgi:signal transduction histidine kinase/CheY-like chemotaxis protein
MTDSNEITAVVLRGSPPLQYRNDKTGNAEGFAVDVLDAVAERAGLQVTYAFAYSWSEMIQKVRSGKADVIASLAISEERQEDLIFSNVIHSSSVSIFVRSQNDNIKELSRALNVATTKGGIPYEYMKKITGLKIKLYETFSEGLFSLLAGEIDAFVAGDAIFLKLARDAGVDDHIKIVGKPLISIKRAIALPKENPRLLTRLNKALKGFVGSPEYQRIYVKWYGKPKPYWTRLRILLLMSVFVIIVVSSMALWRYRSVLKLNRALIDNINERKKLEEQLLQSQKLEAVGRLAGGVAHDFNNMLTAIISYGHLLKMKLKENDPLHHNIDQILSVSDRGSNLIQSLLEFSRKQNVHLNPVRLNTVIEGIKKLTGKFIGEEIELKTRLSEKDLLIHADKTRIEQVLMNLAVNARDAMPDGGVLTIETKQVVMDEEYVRVHEYGRPGIYAMLSVTDTGIGMDDEIKEKIFEPFFTTKEVGSGTGLGLSMVYGIIEQHHGFIQVSSEAGKGTAFTIYFPLIDKEIEDEKRAEALPALHGTGTVLIAEDEKEVRESLKGILEEFGFTVVEALDGQDAVQKFIDNRDAIRLLILDVIMPKKNGKEVYAEIQKTNPEMKALFMSGYTADILQRRGILEEGLTLINKPVSPDDLSREIRELLNV